MIDLSQTSTSQLKTDYQILDQARRYFECLKEWTAVSIKYTGADSSSLSVLTICDERLEKIKQAQRVILEKRGEWCE